MAVVALASSLTCLAPPASFADDARAIEGKHLTMQPIGYIRKPEDRALILLDERYQPGLLGLEGFSHVYVLWWFDRNDTPEKRQILQVHPMGNPENPLTGVFATRSPMRPNLIALTLCKVISVKDNLVEVEKIDAFDGTPVLDVKPFLPGYDSAPDATVPDWVERARELRRSEQEER
jgi:tRNA-Thr(GGU) m(6)t(6)A37 methyltransferase TsaA